jgi:hypothetical protein
MSTAERQDEATQGESPAAHMPRDGAHLRRRRLAAQRRRHLARVDVGLGLAGALILVLATPGLAITGLIALIVLVGCVIAYVTERRRHTRRDLPDAAAPTGSEVPAERGNGSG